MTYSKIERITLGPKVTEKQIDKIIDRFYTMYPVIKAANGLYKIDFSEVEWIANQELLLLTAIMDNLIKAGVKFIVNFLKQNTNQEIEKRQARQLVQIWDVWKIFQIVPDKKYDQYFDIDGRFIDKLKERFGIKSNNQEIYSRYGVTPFISLNKIHNYDDFRIGEMLSVVYRLNNATADILKQYNCELPFLNKTLSLIITKELYENFLDHFKSSFFQNDHEKSYLSLSLKLKLDEKNIAADMLQKILENNFQDECIEESIDFYYDRQKRKFKNLSVVQLSFVDFGEGIAETLKNEYLKANKSDFSTEHQTRHIDTRVLEFAFRYDSSKDPVNKRYSKRTNFPRGLFDLLSIVKRFGGLLIARSNYGKILYDFSNNKSFDQALMYYGNEKLFFPGSLISIYIPERNPKRNIDISAIKPPVNIDKVSFLTKQIKRVSLNDIQKKVLLNPTPKENLYNVLFENIYQEFASNTKGTTIYFDFKGYEQDERISKKVIFFLISDYQINNYTSVIVINPPPKNYLDQVRDEIIALSEVVKNYYVHPTPFVYYDKVSFEISIYWLGVFLDSDVKKLNDLLLQINDLRSSDFAVPEAIAGNVNYYDEKGNLKSLINPSQIRQVLRKEILETTRWEIESILKKFVKNGKNKIFLCNGNYYQFEYFQIADIQKSKVNFQYLCKALYEKILDTIDEIENFKIISITSSSHAIVNLYIESGQLRQENVVKFDNYYSFDEEEDFKEIRKNDKLILICDVISTGYLFTKLQNSIQHLEAEIVTIAVFVSTIDKEFEQEIIDYPSLLPKLASLFTYPIKKYRRKQIINHLLAEKPEIIRINPYSNTIIEFDKNTGYQDTILLTNQEFISIINESHIKAGYFKFNNLIHPYFFDMDKVFKDRDVSKKLLTKIFEKMRTDVKVGIQMIFYPKNSAVQYISRDYIKDELFKDQSILIYELERFSTNEGWKFAHPPSYLGELAQDKKVLILDDGSCSGESIIQMIDEITLLNVKEIVLLSIIGRVNEHKRDFFSRIKVVSNKHNDIKLNVFFGCHWHVPTYYIEESPVSKEKQWLEEVIAIPNMPYKIKTIAENVLSELTLRKIHEPNNNYLITKKDGASDFKELILTKEEIGKIAAYRFYKEYFTFYDKLVSFYDRSERIPNRYQQLELICAVFLHEPDLFEKIKFILPDLTEKIEEFIITILFGNPNREGVPKLNIANLYYNWPVKNVLHLFFIVFKKEKLIEILTLNKLTILIKDFCKKDSDLSYLLYRLLRYMPVNRKEIGSKKYGGQIKYLVEAVTESKVLSQKSISQLKIFTSFISTLPFDYLDFNSHLVKIRENYRRVAEDTFHNEYIYNSKQVLNNQLTVLYKKIIDGNTYENEISSVKNEWKTISSFIEDLLQFSITYPTFFLPLNDKMSDNYRNTQALRKLHGNLAQWIYSDNFIDIVRIKAAIQELFDSYVMEDSKYPKIFENTYIEDLGKIFLDFITQLKEDYPTMIIIPPAVTKMSINFPQIYLKEIVFKEILKNFRYADLTKPVTFKIKENIDSLQLKIENHLNKTVYSSGGGKGLNKLGKLNGYPIKTTYKSTNQDTTFIQHLVFKKL